MERLQRIFGASGMGQPPSNLPLLDSSEQVYILSLALLKTLKHGRAGVPMEVMGLMLGEFVDDYTRSGWSMSSPCRRAGPGSASRPSTMSSRPTCSTCLSRLGGQK